MQLLCNYDCDAPIVVHRYEDSDTVDMTRPDHTPFVLVPFQGNMNDLGKVGPEPQLMGDPPTECYPDHAKLDEEGVPRFISDKDGEPIRDDEGHKVPHPLRLVAGKPYPDNRRLADDLRPYAAPSQALPDVQKAYLAHVRWAKEVGGTKVGDFPAYTSRETRAQTEADASRASRDPKFTKRVKGTDGAFYDLDAKKLIAVADAVSDHVQACFDAEAKVLADIDAGKVKDFNPINEAFAKL